MQKELGMGAEGDEPLAEEPQVCSLATSLRAAAGLRAAASLVASRNLC